MKKNARLKLHLVVKGKEVWFLVLDLFVMKIFYLCANSFNDLEYVIYFKVKKWKEIILMLASLFRLNYNIFVI